MKYETVTVASLMLDPANVRKHDHKNIDAIKASYARFGQQKPIVVDGDGIVRDGNGQLMAAKALGMAYRPWAPVKRRVDAPTHAA